MVTTKAFERSINISDTIAQEVGTDQETVRRVLQAAKAKEESRRRRPAPPPPTGGISQSAASRKYGVARITIWGWVHRKKQNGEYYIPVLLKTKKEVYIDEAKLAEVVECFKKSPGQGKKTVKRKFAS
jgi:transposase